MRWLKELGFQLRAQVQDAAASSLPAAVPSPALKLSDKIPSSNMIPSLRTLAKFFMGSTQIAMGPAYHSARAQSPTCPAGGPLSCSSSAAGTCCYNAPGGLLLQTQFWDASPSTGPNNSWTIHGLWPDNCDGTYQANCDASRAYTNISDIIRAAGQDALLNDMNIYWKDYKGNDASFWEHEWGKHGTCINTLDPSCYTDYQPQEEVVDFFMKTVSLFKGLDSYQALAAAGITPSNSQTYTSADIQAALTQVTGHPVTLGCRSGALNEVWYYYNVQGNVQSGSYVPTDPDGSKSTCPATGVKYLPKGGDGYNPPPTTSPTTTMTASTTSTTDSSRPTGDPFFGKGYLKIDTGGCLISTGKWFTSGTCATYTAAPFGSGFTLTSSKGNCAIASGVFTCGRTVLGDVFSSSNGLLVSSGNDTSFYADAVPRGWTQQPVYTSGHSTIIQILFQKT
ncbi:MAG: ribonuclease T2-like [Vezdaea acicularis]|nr:MAG: ribonuclease T2-like [Vezdaea acicularis]